MQPNLHPKCSPPPQKKANAKTQYQTPHIKTVETIDSITVNGKPRLIVMSDEGNASKKLTAKFMMVNYSTLSKD